MSIARVGVKHRALSLTACAGADGLKLALALLWERRRDFPGATPVACVHDEILLECEEDNAKKGEAREAMIDGMDQVLNGSGGAHVLVELETQIAKTWAG